MLNNFRLFVFVGFHFHLMQKDYLRSLKKCKTELKSLMDSKKKLRSLMDCDGKLEVISEDLTEYELVRGLL